MDFITKHWVAMIAIVIAIVACFLPVLPHGKSVFGTVSTSCSGYTSCVSDLYLTTQFGGSGSLQTDGTLKVGSGGTAQSNQVITTCSPVANNSITASTTGYAYCTGVTGITSADFILAQFSTSTLGYAASLDDFFVVSAKASTTPGAIDLLVFNASGKTQAPSAGSKTASTTVIWGGH